MSLKHYMIFMAIAMTIIINKMVLAQAVVPCSLSTTMNF